MDKTVAESEKADAEDAVAKLRKQLQETECVPTALTMYAVNNDLEVLQVVLKDTTYFAGRRVKSCQADLADGEGLLLGNRKTRKRVVPGM